MRKFVLLFLSLFGLVGLTHAAPNCMDGVSGFECKSSAGGPLALAFTPIAADGSYTVTASRLVAIFTEDPGIPAAIQVTSPDTGKPNWILKTLPAGSKLYVGGLGDDWGGTEDGDINKIDLSKALASGEIHGDTATLTLVRSAGQKVRAVNWVIVMPGNKRSWGPTGYSSVGKSSPYHVSVGGQPATAWAFNGNAVGEVSAGQREFLANAGK